MRGENASSKIFYKGKSDDFIIFIEDVDTLRKWKTDSTVPLSDVINGWKIFVTHKYASPTYFSTPQ